MTCTKTAYRLAGEIAFRDHAQRAGLKLFPRGGRERYGVLVMDGSNTPNSSGNRLKCHSNSGCKEVNYIFVALGPHHFDEFPNERRDSLAYFVELRVHKKVDAPLRQMRY